MTINKMYERLEELDYLTGLFNDETLLKEYEWYKKLLEGMVC
jgi:hypothetical protein